MADEKRDSSQRLLDEVEGGWSSPSSARVPAAKAAEVPADGADGAAVEEPAPISTPTLDSLDAGWIDELFDEEEDDEEEDEPEESEPELPDEALDPVAYAEAKKAREAREEARRQKRKARAEAKKARRKARAAQVQQKQKQKKRKAGAPKDKRGKLPADSPKKRAPVSEPDASDDDDAAPVASAKVVRKPVPASRPLDDAPSGPPWKLAAIAIAVFLAAAAAIAAIASR